jgi:diaminopimelate epimerase
VKLRGYESLGNKFLIVENDEKDFQKIEKLCKEAKRLNFDGLLIVGSEGANVLAYKVFVYNVDGSYGEFSVNGARCAALYLMEKNNKKDEEFFVGRVFVKANRERENFISVEVKVPVVEAVELELALNKKSIVGTLVNIGNPHLLFHGDNKLTKEEFVKIAPTLSRGNTQTNGAVNVSFFWRESADCYRAIVCERGVGFTKFCGSAALAFWTINSFEKNISISMPGGKTELSYSGDGFVKILASVEEICPEKTFL